MSAKASSPLLSEEYKKTRGANFQLKRLSTSRSSSYGNGATASELLALIDNLRAHKANVTATKSLPGLADYAKAQEADTNYDAVKEYNALLSRIDSVIAEVISVIPKDADGYMLLYKIDADGAISPRSFDAADLTNLITLLNNITSSID